MSSAPNLVRERVDLPEGEGPPILRTVRSEARRDEVRIVEYAPFPRASGREARIGFTRDFAPSGMCIGVDEREPLGALLRLDVRGLDGRSVRASIARVVWCTTARDGRHWLGLQVLCDADRPEAAESFA